MYTSSFSSDLQVVYNSLLNNFLYNENTRGKHGVELSKGIENFK